MHDTAYRLGQAFFESYVRAGDRIIEIGSMDVNGSLRDFCPTGSRYVGVDMAPGPSVDIVASASQIPFAADSFDAVVSSSCFEHDNMFWLTFLEVCRVLKPGGYIYINAPSRGDYHTYPIDAWRFFPDAGMALAAWAKRSGYDINLLESFIAEGDDFGDCVMIFGKRAEPPPVLVAQRYRDVINLRCWPDLETLARRTRLWPRARRQPAAAATGGQLGHRVAEEILSILQDSGTSFRRCLEWSGGATGAIAEYAKSKDAEFFLSIDHDAQRQRQMMARLPKYPFMHCRLIDCEEPTASADGGNVDPAYITYPLGLAGEFDAIIVAGRRRMACTLAAAMVAAPGALVLVLDDEQPRHRALRRFLDDAGSSVATEVGAVLDDWRAARNGALAAVYGQIEESGHFLVLRANSGRTANPAMQ